MIADNIINYIKTYWKSIKPQEPRAFYSSSTPFGAFMAIIATIHMAIAPFF